jgi:6-phosphogluconolactonase
MGGQRKGPRALFPLQTDAAENTSSAALLRRPETLTYRKYAHLFRLSRVLHLRHFERHQAYAENTSSAALLRFLRRLTINSMYVMNPFPGNVRLFRIPELICLLLVVLLATVAEALDYEYLVYVGTYTGRGSSGIYAYRFDPAAGESVSLGLAASTNNPSFLAVDPKGRFLYAVNELDTFQNRPTGAVSVFGIDRGSGKLKLLQQTSSLGRGPAHLSLDKSARYLMVANYNSGNCAVFPIGDDGLLGPHSAFVQDVGSSVNTERRVRPRAHFIQVTNDNRTAIVADLGLDELLLYRFADKVGSLAPDSPASVKVAPGGGPRHVAFAPSGKSVYVVNETASTVTVFDYESGTGTLHEKQTIATLPEDFSGKNAAAEISLDARGRFLYVSNRGHDSIVVFSVNAEDGRLTPVEWVPSGGKTPRNFTIDPTGKWLFAANQDSNEVRIFQVDPSTGRLIPTSRSLTVVSPVCVLISPTKGISGTF